mgnify:CR=1 FL=1
MPEKEQDFESKSPRSTIGDAFNDELKEKLRREAAQNQPAAEVQQESKEQKPDDIKSIMKETAEGEEEFVEQEKQVWRETETPPDEQVIKKQAVNPDTERKSERDRLIEKALLIKIIHLINKNTIIMLKKLMPLPYLKLSGSKISLIWRVPGFRITMPKKM